MALVKYGIIAQYSYDLLASLQLRMSIYAKVLSVGAAKPRISNDVLLRSWHIEEISTEVLRRALVMSMPVCILASWVVDIEGGKYRLRMKCSVRISNSRSDRRALCRRIQGSYL